MEWKSSGSPTQSARRRLRPRTLGLAALISGVALAGAPMVAAAVTPDSEPTYTGCLRVGGSNPGTFVAIKSGSAPLRTCTDNEQQMRVSGGDITSVSAGTGIQLPNAGGLGLTDTQGDATVGLDPKYQLPQTCLTGEIVFARPQSTGSKWGCTAAPPSALPAAVVSRQGAPNGQQTIGTSLVTLGTPVNLGAKAGSWILNVRIGLRKAEENDIDDLVADCRLDVSGQPGPVDSGYVFQDSATSTYFGRTTINLTGGAVAPAGAVATIRCSDGGRQMEWTDFSFTATPVQSIVQR